MTLFAPDWKLPAGVAAMGTTRHGGVSLAPWDSLNLGHLDNPSDGAGDLPQAITANRQIVACAMGARPVWLRQVHGVEVLRLQSTGPQDLPAADAAWTTEPGLACAVLVADCLPVLLCSGDGRAVAAAHAGWRGLAAGVLEATIASMQQQAGVERADMLAWLGPCIGPRQFEVGADVLQAFGVDGDTDGNSDGDTDANPAAAALFLRRTRPDGSARWLADLPAVARLRLQRAGLRHISMDGRCTVEQRSDFFSFRRDGVTGRQAAAIWRCA